MLSAQEVLQKMDDLIECDVSSLVEMRDVFLHSEEDYALEMCKIDQELLRRITE